MNDNALWCEIVYDWVMSLWFPGGIFEDMYEGSKLAFQQAVEKINSRRDLLADIKLSYDITKCPPQDSFTADRQGMYIY